MGTNLSRAFVALLLTTASFAIPSGAGAQEKTDAGTTASRLFVRSTADDTPAASTLPARALRPAATKPAPANLVTIDTWFHVISSGAGTSQGNVPDSAIASQL